MDNPSYDNKEEREDGQGSSGDGPLYFQLEKDNDKGDTTSVNENSCDYDRLNCATKLNDYDQNGDDGAYQHIQLQASPVGNDEDYQHLNRSSIR